MKTLAKRNNPKIEKPEELNFSDMLFKYMRYWKLFLALLVVAPILALFYLKYQVPIYSVTASILIKDEKTGIDKSSILESLDMFGSKKIVENEIEVLKSRDLVKQVVNNLKLYATFYEEGRLKHISAYNISPVKLEVKHPENLNGQNRISFSFDKKTNEVVINEKKFPVDKWLLLGGDSVRFIANSRYTGSYIGKPLYVVLNSTKAAVAELSGQISVSSVNKEATVIDLEIKDQAPSRGEDILNELIRVYNKAAIDDKNSLAANTLAFVEERLRSVVAELGQVEGAIQQFKTTKGIVDISQQGKLFLENVGSNDQKIAEMNVQLAVLDQVEKYVLSRNEQAGIVPSTLGVNDNVLSQLLKTLYDLQLEYEKLKKTTGENNAVLISIKDQIEKVRPNILENINNQRNSLTAGRSTLNVNSNHFSSLLKNIPKNERELLEISRQQVIKNNIYSFLLQKREETALSFASTVSDTRIVDTAEAALAPVSPKKQLIYFSSIIAALVIGVLIISLKEMLNQTVITRADMEKLLLWPVIGELALDPSRKPIIVAEGQRNIIAEQFRQIRTRLAYFGINENKKTILITSSISGEGKSFVAVNLAMSLALTGKKVVLLELDLRKPKLSPLFSEDFTEGLTNYIIGRSEIDDIIKPTSQNENLFFIPSGPIPPNPSELLLSDKMDVLFGFLNQSFDYIIVDTAPVVPVTDADILSKFVDTTLFIVRQNYTPTEELKKLGENDNTSGLKNVTIIFNAVKRAGRGKYGSNYSGYNYGYINEDPKPGKKAKKVLPIFSKNAV